MTNNFMEALQGMLNGEIWEKKSCNRLEGRGMRYKISFSTESYAHPRVVLEYMTPKGWTWVADRKMSMDYFSPANTDVWVKVGEQVKLKCMDRIEAIEAEVQQIKGMLEMLIER